MKILFSTIFSLLILSGCANEPQVAQKNPYAPPAWVNGAEGAVGICDEHMKGRAAQEQVAMDRALEILAKQQGALVQTNSKSSQTQNGASYSSSFGSKTNIQATTKVKAHIKDSWRDPRTNRYYVLMVLD